MRSLFVLVTITLVLTGCNSSTSSGGWGYGSAAAPVTEASSTETAARLENWEQQWAAARTEVTQARSQAVAAESPPSPALDQEVTELLERDLTSPDPEVQIEKLQDAVSDALRLAELVSIG